MSLRWDFDKRIGARICLDSQGNEYRECLYRGNAFLIVTHEWVDDKGHGWYSITDFWADKEHAKNCLGLSKDYEPCDYSYIVSWTFYNDMLTPKELTDFIGLILKGISDSTILITHSL